MYRKNRRYQIDSVPRPVNFEVHQERRGAFLDVARRLIVTKGVWANQAASTGFLEALTSTAILSGQRSTDCGTADRFSCDPALDACVEPDEVTAAPRNSRHQDGRQMRAREGLAPVTRSLTTASPEFSKGVEDQLLQDGCLVQCTRPASRDVVPPRAPIHRGRGVRDPGQHVWFARGLEQFLDGVLQGRDRVPRRTNQVRDGVQARLRGLLLTTGTSSNRPHPVPKDRPTQRTQCRRGP